MIKLYDIGVETLIKTEIIMEFYSHETATVGPDRRFIFPIKWSREVREFFLVRDKDLLLYPFEVWKQIRDGMLTTAERVDWTKKSSILQLSSKNRMSLPKDCNCRQVDMLGNGDHIIIEFPTQFE
ncbi:hypothetical protein GW864_02330 [bacterium]|nr:hypothetical protein [bacterium]